MMSDSANSGYKREIPPRRVVIVIYPGVTLLDAAGPAQVFTTANNADAIQPGTPRYEVVLASPAGGEIATDTGIAVGTLSLEQAAADPVDTLVIAGGDGIFELIEEQTLVDWVCALQDDCRRIASTCMGAFLTARAGLLDGKAATTHWRYVADLQRHHPEIDVKCDPLFLKDGKIWSSAGVTAGIDLAIAMVEEDHGHETAMQVAQSLVVFFKRPGGQSQFSNVLRAQQSDRDGTFSDLHAWIAANLQNDLSVERLAQHAGMTPRTFARRYRERTGVTPARSVEMLRVDAAKRLLKNGAHALAEVAAASGLGDEQRLRRAFMRHVGTSPVEYRNKFSGKLCG